MERAAVVLKQEAEIERISIQLLAICNSGELNKSYALWKVLQ